MQLSQVQNILKFVCNLSPAQVGKWMCILRNQHRASKIVEYPAPRLTKSYFARQHDAILMLFRMLENGADLEQIFKQQSVLPFGERIVEYPYFHKWLMAQEGGHDILDVGCVLNNECVEKVLKKQCESVWFCNPSIEKSINISNPVFYHLSTLGDSFGNGQQFMLVTCLSTIEHIGYDNSQYGVTSPAKYHEPSIEPFVTAFEKLGKLTAPGGSLLISFPFGYREVLLNPGTGKISSQVMDYESLLRCLPAFDKFNITYKLVVYEATPVGWEQVDPASCFSRYAEGRPGATAVAIIDAKKVRESYI